MISMIAKMLVGFSLIRILGDLARDCASGRAIPSGLITPNRLIRADSLRIGRKPALIVYWVILIVRVHSITYSVIPSYNPHR